MNFLKIDRTSIKLCNNRTCVIRQIKRAVISWYWIDYWTLKFLIMIFVCDLYCPCFVFLYSLDSWIHVCIIIYFIEQPKPEDLCNPSPCGPNADCREGICTCLPNYFGDPYSYCRPECTMNSDCSRVKACVNQFCVDPCIGTCGTNAKCDVVNHIPMCSCFPGTTGDPFTLCRPQISEGVYNIHMSFSFSIHTNLYKQSAEVHEDYIKEILIDFSEPRKQPCTPSPCGPNSICKVVNDHAVCSCQTDFIGSPPACRPECVVSAECPLTQACLANKCQDPCPGTCGQNTKCQVVNHNPICSCSEGHTGDPFTRCYIMPSKLSCFYI